LVGSISGRRQPQVAKSTFDAASTAVNILGQSRPPSAHLSSLFLPFILLFRWGENPGADHRVES